MITVYTLPRCPHCVEAKHYLIEHAIDFEEVDVSQNAEALAFLRSQGHGTVPQLYMGAQLLVEGGNATLQSLSDHEFRTRMNTY